MKKINWGKGIMKKANILRGITTAAGIAGAVLFTITAAAKNSRFDNSISRDDNNNICINFSEVEVLLPSDWAGKCRIVTSSDSAEFFHIKSQDKFKEDGLDGGWLFTVSYSPNTDFMVQPDFVTLGEVDDGYYYAAFPTDVQAYLEDGDACSEYFSLYQDIDWVQENMSLVYFDDTSVISSEEEYIFPDSSTRLLSSGDLSGMDTQKIQMAINEIYARHHRKFVMQEVQDYFNSKSWYEGTIEAEDFDPSVMNSYESANIELMVKALSQVSDSGTISSSSARAADSYGMIIECGSGYFRVRQQDGSIIQFWYDNSRLGSMGLTADDITVGSTISLIYNTETYEATSILIW